MKHLIYALIDQNCVPYYVGKTCNLAQRKRQHLARMKAGSKCYVYNKIRKLIASGISLNAVVLENDIDVSSIDSREIHHIARLKLLGHTLCNLTDGGEGNSEPSEELKKRWSESHKLFRHSAESKKKISDARKGIKFTNEHRSKLKAARQKRITSAKTREIMRTSSLGKINTKCFKCISPDGIQHLTLKGLTAFCRDMHLPVSSMHRIRDSGKKYNGWMVQSHEPNPLNNLG
jgi:hypothetical protein